jgi:hypothetical protein
VTERLWEGVKNVGRLKVGMFKRFNLQIIVFHKKSHFGGTLFFIVRELEPVLITLSGHLALRGACPELDEGPILSLSKGSV